MSQITPRAVANIGWKTLLMFAIFNFANVVYVWFIIKETNGKSLEEMEVVFGTVHHVSTRDAQAMGDGSHVSVDTKKNTANGTGQT